MDLDHKIAHLWKKRMNRHAKKAYPIRKTMLATELAQQMEKPKAELPQPYTDPRDICEKKNHWWTPSIKNLWPYHWTQ